jgi:hypothetical protein
VKLPGKKRSRASAPEDADRIVKPTPDPTVLTTEASDRAKAAEDHTDTLRQNALERELGLRRTLAQNEVESLKDNLESSTASLQAQITLFREDDRELTVARLELVKEMIGGIRREIVIYETHRLELKGDSEKTLSTATIAAEKAVQAALAAAEKARDQQTIASQLATTKAEEASKEQMKQQGETFTLAIQSLTTGLSDVKSMLGELRAEKRGSQEQVVVTRDTAADMKPMVDAIAKLAEIQSMAAGKQQQVVETRAISMQTIAFIALFATVLGGVLARALGF